MVASETWLTGGASRCGGFTAVGDSYGVALLRAARRAGTAVAGIAQVPNVHTSPELRSEGSKAVVGCYPEAQPPAKSVAGRVAGPSSDGSSPADLLGHEVRGVAG